MYSRDEDYSDYPTWQIQELKEWRNELLRQMRRRQIDSNQPVDGVARDDDGFDHWGYDKDGYDREGFNREGLNRSGIRREVIATQYNTPASDEELSWVLELAKYHRNQVNENGIATGVYLDDDGFDFDGYDSEGFNREGFNRYGLNRRGEPYPEHL